MIWKYFLGLCFCHWLIPLFGHLPTYSWPYDSAQNIQFNWFKAEGNFPIYDLLTRMHLNTNYGTIKSIKPGKYDILFSLHNFKKDTAYLYVSAVHNMTIHHVSHIIFGHKQVYWSEKDSWKKQKQQRLLNWPQSRKFLLVIPPCSRDTVLARCTFYYGKKIDHRLLTLTNLETEQKYNCNQFLPHVFIKGFGMGIYLFLFGLAFSRLLLIKKEPANFYFAAYILTILLLIWRHINQQYLYFDFISNTFPIWLMPIRSSIVFSSIICYQCFFKHILPKEQIPIWLNLYILISNSCLALFIVIQLVGLSFEKNYNFVELTMLIILFGPMLWLYFLYHLNRINRDPIVNILFWGTICLSLGMLLNQVLEQVWSVSEFLSWQELPVQIGGFFQLGAFASALSKKHQLSFENKILAEQKYADSLESFIEQTSRYDQRLNEDLQKQAQQLNLQYNLRIEQEMAYIQAKYRHELAEVELRALREQIKPHFIANAINSITSLINQGRMESAEQYLFELKEFLRLIHQYSEYSYIHLSQELGLLQHYLNLESMRFQNRFKVSYKLAAYTDASPIYIPPLLLQFFAENAIKHAFLVDKPDQVLRIHFQPGLEPGAWLIVIEDNGIGRKATTLVPKIEKSGLGGQLVAQRVELFNKLDVGKINVQYIDLYDDRQYPLGLRVEIIFQPSQES